MIAWSLIFAVVLALTWFAWVLNDDDRTDRVVHWLQYWRRPR